MIFGIGTDIVRVERMIKNLERFGEQFAERILTTEEMVEFRAVINRANFLAKRFAAKEAAVKALGTGFSQGIHLREISVGHDEHGKPILQLSGRALAYAQEKGVVCAHISLADEADHAVAFVTLESGR
jgi:holo-[acyl-carrier protein] synthase